MNKYNINKDFIYFILLLINSIIIFSCSPKEKIEDNDHNQENYLIEDKLNRDYIRLVYSDVEAFPIQMGNGNRVANPPGVALDIIKQAAVDLNLDIRFDRRPNKRVLLELAEGDADGAFCFSYKKKREKNGQYPMEAGKLDSSSRITSISYFLYKKKGSKIDWDGEKILNLNGAIGANTGYSIVEDLRKKGIVVEEAKTTEQNFTKLQFDRIEAYATQDITGDYFAFSGKYGEIEKVPIPLASKDYFLIFSHQFMKRNPEFAWNLWNKIGKIRDRVTKTSIKKYKRITNE